MEIGNNSLTVQLLGRRGEAPVERAASVVYLSSTLLEFTLPPTLANSSSVALVQLRNAENVIQAEGSFSLYERPCADGCYRLLSGPLKRSGGHIILLEVASTTFLRIPRLSLRFCLQSHPGTGEDGSGMVEAGPDCFPQGVCRLHFSEFDIAAVPRFQCSVVTSELAVDDAVTQVWLQIAAMGAGGVQGAWLPTGLAVPLVTELPLHVGFLFPYKVHNSPWVYINNVGRIALEKNLMQAVLTHYVEDSWGVSSVDSGIADATAFGHAMRLIDTFNCTLLVWAGAQYLQAFTNVARARPDVQNLMTSSLLTVTPALPNAAFATGKIYEAYFLVSPTPLPS